MSTCENDITNSEVKNNDCQILAKRVKEKQESQILAKKVKERDLIEDTDSGHNLIPRLQKNSSRRAPSLKWTRIKMERFFLLHISSSFFCISFSPR